MSGRCSTFFVRLGLILILVLGLPRVCSAEDKVTVEPVEKWGTVFGEDKADFHFRVQSSRAFKGKAGWTFFTVANRHTIATGESDVAAAPGKPGVLEVRLQVPTVNPGVTLQTRLKVTVTGAGADAEAVYEKRIWIFPRDPFADRKDWLKDLKISLLDPEKTTAAAFAKLKIPFDEVNNPAAVADLKEGLLIVGEGVSFAEGEYRDLPEALARAAARGVPVLCLAPSAGALPIPGADGAHVPAPVRLSLRRSDVITELDKKLDAEAWPPDAQVVISALAVKAADGQVVGEVDRKGTGWPWLEATYAEKDARLVVCGFGLLGKHWDQGPTPRFLLARILESMTKKAEKQPADAKENER